MIGQHAAGVFGPGGHQRVLHGHDRSTGLRAIIAIHDTTLGPALGGTRFYDYADEASALSDVLRLSRGMTYKAAMAGLALGGGKAVILGDPAQLKTADLLRAYGRLVESLGGDYITAGDVGTTSEDMDVIGQTTEHVVARTVAQGGSGDSALLTAYGVFQSMRAAAQHVWGEPGLGGRVVGVEGLGKVGHELVRLLLADGASVVAGDVSPTARERAASLGSDVRLADDILGTELDVYAPCAMGATLTPATAASLRATVVCGAANNQLSEPGVEKLLIERGATWVPDYVANAGGVIQVAGERTRSDSDLVRHQVTTLFDTVGQLLAVSRRDGVTAGEAADSMAEQRLEQGAHRRQAVRA